MTDSLTTIRTKIDTIDQQIQELINQRAQCNLAVAKIKQQTSKDPHYYRPEREAQILRNVIARNKGPLPNKAMAEIFLEILARCRALQKPITLAIFGAQRNFTHQAALKHFGTAIKTKFIKSVSKLFHEVAEKKAQYGIVPIEDYNKSTFLETLNALTDFSLQICGEIEFKAIRYLIVGTEHTAPSSYDKTSLAIFIANQPGALVKILQPFEKNHLNVTFMEYFPYHGNLRNFVFFIDIQGHQQDAKVQQALQELSQQPLSYITLGSYPRAVL